MLDTKKYVKLVRLFVLLYESNVYTLLSSRGPWPRVLPHDEDFHPQPKEEDLRPQPQEEDLGPQEAEGRRPEGRRPGGRRPEGRRPEGRKQRAGPTA